MSLNYAIPYNCTGRLLGPLVKCVITLFFFSIAEVTLLHFIYSYK